MVPGMLTILNADFVAEQAMFDSYASTKVNSESGGSEFKPKQIFAVQEESNAGEDSAPDSTGARIKTKSGINRWKLLLTWVVALLLESNANPDVLSLEKYTTKERLEDYVFPSASAAMCEAFNLATDFELVPISCEANLNITSWRSPSEVASKCIRPSSYYTAAHWNNQFGNYESMGRRLRLQRPVCKA